MRTCMFEAEEGGLTPLLRYSVASRLILFVETRLALDIRQQATQVAVAAVRAHGDFSGWKILCPSMLLFLCNYYII